MVIRDLARPFEWLVDRVATGVAATGIRPGILTWLCVLVQSAAAVLFAQGRFAAAGVAMIAAGFFDVMDGPVARKQGRETSFGIFLDSILDRYSDLILFLGVLVYYAQVNRFPYAVLAGAAMAGAVMVSYAKARAESLIGPRDMGFWERPERIILMIIAALANKMPLGLWLLAIGPNITVIHRIIYTWKQTGGERRAIPAERPGAAQEAPVGKETPALIGRAAHRGG